MAAYSSAVQRRYMLDHAQSRDIIGLVYMPPDVTTEACACTLYSAVLMAHCPLRTRLVVVHADDDAATDTAIECVRSLMRMLRRRNLTESVCTHVEDNTTCIQASAIDRDGTLTGYFSCGALIRAGVVMAPRWDQRMVGDMSAQKDSLYACWAQTVEHTFGHVASVDEATRVKQYVDRVFDEGISEGSGDERPLFPQLLYGAGFDEGCRSIPDVYPVACLGGGSAVGPVESALCSATMCFGPLEIVSRCCTLLPVLCAARLSRPHMDILVTAYLTRLLSITTYHVPSHLMCRSFFVDDDAPSAQEDVVHLRDYLYTADDAGALSFRRERLGVEGAAATCRRRRMMGLVGGSKEEIQHKYRSMDMYMRVYRQRLREERIT